MKLTPFGERVRVYRLELSMRLKNMAEALGVSSSYLSGVETGRKELTDKFVGRVVKYFESCGIVAEDLYEMADRSRKEIKIKTDGLDEESRDLVAAFARRFSQLPSDKKREMKQMLLKFDD